MGGGGGVAVGRGNLSTRCSLRPFKGRRDLFWVGGSLRFSGCPSSFGTISLFSTINVALAKGVCSQESTLAITLCYSVD